MIENQAKSFDYLSKVQNKVLMTSLKYKYKKQNTKFEIQNTNTNKYKIQNQALITSPAARKFFAAFAPPDA